MSNVQLITRALEPIYHSNTRTRFKLNCLNSGLLPNLRLCNVAVTNVNWGAVVPRDLYYVADSGALALIKRITLLEKGNPIEDLTHRAAEYMTFLNTLDSEENTNNVRQYTIKSRQGLVVNVDSLNDILRLNPSVNGDSKVVSADLLVLDPTSENSARLDLQQYFNFLRSEDLLVGFKDMELVIEWKTTATEIFSDFFPLTGQPTSWDVNQPLLVFEEILDKEIVAKQAMAKRGTQTAFITPEMELLSVPATVSTNPVTTRLRLQSVKNKIVHKLLVATNDLVENPSNQTGKNNSVAQPSEVWQVYVNNAQLFTNPLDSESRKLATLQDSFGRQLVAWFQNRTLYDNSSTFIQSALSTDDDLEFGTNSYFGCDIKDVVTDLRLELTRTYNAVAGFGGNALELVCFPLVEKYVQYQKDGANIVSYRPM